MLMGQGEPAGNYDHSGNYHNEQDQTALRQGHSVPPFVEVNPPFLAGFWISLGRLNGSVTHYRVLYKRV